MTNALDTQVGGAHYKRFKIQPIQLMHANDLGASECNVVKYVSRYRFKNGLEDLDKVVHYIDLHMELVVQEPFLVRAMRQDRANRQDWAIDPLHYCVQNGIDNDYERFLILGVHHWRSDDMDGMYSVKDMIRAVATLKTQYTEAS